MGKPKLYRAHQGDSSPIQGFIAHPTLTTTVSSSDPLSVENITAIRISGTDVTYQINGVGPEIFAQAGQIILMHRAATSITFIGLATTTCEVME